MQFTASHAISEQCVGVGEALARAFHDDPVFSYMLGRNDFPNSKAQRFFRTFYNLQLSQELSYTAHDATGKCLGASIWCAPDAWKVRLRDIARIAPTLTTVFGAGLPRALIALQRLEHLHPKEPHYYLEFIGTDPDAQGNGGQPGNTFTPLVNGFAIPKNNASSVATGKIIIESLDSIRAWTTNPNACRITLSVLETANA